MFGELLLGVDQDEVSRLLKISDDCDLSFRDREAFNKMKHWLDCSENVHGSQNLAKSSESSSVSYMVSETDLSNNKIVPLKKRSAEDAYASLEPPRKSQVSDWFLYKFKQLNKSNKDF